MADEKHKFLDGYFAEQFAARAEAMTPTPTVERGPNEVVERVAGAIQARLDSMPHKGDIDAGQFFREMACAAIEALREPSPEMLAAMKPWTEASGHPELVWRAGIAAALGGKS